MIKSYTFTPRKISRSKSKLTTKEAHYIKIIIRSFILYLIIGGASFFGAILIFSNINSFWGIFKPSEKYVEENTVKPSKPYLKTETESTNKETVDLDGIAENGKKVILYKNDKEETETIANNENKYFFNSIKINTTEGETTTFYTIVKGDKGNDSNRSNEVTVTYDKTKPRISVEYPKPDERINSFSRTLEVKGRSEEEGVEITINGRIARKNTSNEFSATIGLEDEVNVIKVISKDKAGNETIIEIPVYFEKKD